MGSIGFIPDIGFIGYIVDCLVKLPTLWRSSSQPSFGIL
jgi:hypothetical protein